MKKQEDIRSLGKKFWDNSQARYGANSHAAIMIISGNRSNMGTVVNANHELDQILGYKKSELIGENISLIMPEIIGRHHNLFLQNYFEKHEQTTNEIAKERLVFAQHTKGFLVPIMLFVRVIPNLENGVQFLGFLTQPKNLEDLLAGDVAFSNDDVLLLLLDPVYKLVGFNCNVAKLCHKDGESTNYHKYLESNQKIDLSKLYPVLIEEDNIASLRSPFGLSLQLDIMLLKQALYNEIVDTYEEKEYE